MSDLPLKFDANGLLPVVVQDLFSGEIRMVAFASPEAVRATLESGRATFFSRSRNELWEKGKTSGHSIVVRRVLVDCDADCLIYCSDPVGPSCHTGSPSCFFRALEGETLVERPVEPQTVLGSLEATLEARKDSSAAQSYARSLYDGGASLIGAKVREEAGEFAQALAREADDRVVAEAADLLFHTLVGLHLRGLTLRHVLEALDARAGKSGHHEKAERAVKRP